MKNIPQIEYQRKVLLHRIQCIIDEMNPPTIPLIGVFQAFIFNEWIKHDIPIEIIEENLRDFLEIYKRFKKTSQPKEKDS